MVLTAAGVLLASSAGAQSVRLPSAEACDGWSRALEAGGPGAVKALTEGWLAACDVGPSSMAAAVQRAGTLTDRSLLFALATQAGQLTHPSILQAALALAADRGATREGRIAGFMILSGQLGETATLLIPPAGTLADTSVFIITPPASGLCGPTPLLEAPEPPAAVPLPDDAGRPVARVLDRIRFDAGEPEQIRNLARCYRSSVGPDIPPQIDLTGVTAALVCQNRFRVHNPTLAALSFDYGLESDEDGYDLTLGPGETRVLEPWGTGAFRLVYDGVVIRTIANTTSACPSPPA